MPVTITREEAINSLRQTLLQLVDDEHSMCEVATRLNIYCRGFRQWTDEELRERYSWIVSRFGIKDRAQLEDLANRWQLARQIVQDEALSCDVQQLEHDTCDGWDTHSNIQLTRYCKELLDKDVEVVDEPRSRLGIV